MLWGNKSAGKSGLCLELIASAQKDGKTCAYVDAEKTFDPAWAARLGVNVDDLAWFNLSTISQVADIGGDLVDGGLDLLIIDSINGLSPSSWHDDGQIKAFDDTKQIGTFSKDIGNCAVRLNLNNEKTAIVWISHITTNLGGHHAMLTPTGGNKFLHMNSTVIKLWGTNNLEKQVKSEGKPVGRPVNWSIEWNKMAPPNQYGSYNFYYDGDFVGIDKVAEIVGICVQYDIMVKAGGWIKYQDKSWREKELTDLLRSDKDEYAKVLAELGLRMNGEIP